MDSKIKTTLLECITTGMNSPHRCIECWNEANKKLIWNDGNEVIFVQLCILAAERARNNPKEMKGVSLQIREHGNILDDYDADRVTKHLKGSELALGVDVGVGRGRATVWTTDCSVGYG